MGMSLEVIVLAAGKGTRMKSALPKVLHRVAGRPMLGHVIDRATELNAQRIHVVIGHGAEKVRETFPDTALNWVMQTEQLGTGHAVAQALPDLDSAATVLVLYGDVPLTRTDTLDHLVDLVDDGHMALLTVHMDDPGGYGRIVRNTHGDIIRIVEQKDASAEHLEIHEVNTGILAVQAARLQEWLPRLSNQNAQGEYYLTDIIAMAAETGTRVRSAHPDHVYEVQGANDRQQLAELERWYQKRATAQLMREGAALIDPARVDIRGTVEVGEDVEIDVNVILEGRVILGAGARIGAQCTIRDSVIGAGSQVLENCVIDNARLGEQCSVGPFARLRPGTELEAGARIGNFVETKNARLGPASKVNHLTYVGDAQIGARSNIGAGTITCNYDGANKHQTQIGDDAFIGSNSSLVAPVKIGDGATVGAGSVIAKDVTAGALAVARGRQKELANWKRPGKK